MLVLMFLDFTESIKEEAMKCNIYPFISPHVFDVVLITCVDTLIYMNAWNTNHIKAIWMVLIWNADSIWTKLFRELD